MEIRCYWPDCNLIKKQWVRDKIDSYWVECTFEDALKEVFPYLSYKQKKQRENYWKPEEDIICFLISKDLKSIETFPRNYPISAQWNGYSPFQAIKEREIKKLEEIRELTIVKSIDQKNA